MKKKIVIIIALIGIYACKDEGQFTVTGSVEGIEDGKEVIIQKLGADNKFVILDTLIVKKGAFTYTGKAGIPEMHYFFIESIQGALPVIVEPGDIKATVYKDSLSASVITGTPYNDDFNRLKEEMKRISDKNALLRKEALEARQKNDSAGIAALTASYKALQEEAIKIQKDFAGEHPRSYVTAIVLKQLLLTRAQGVTIEEIQAMYNALPEEIKATREAEEVKEQLNKIGKTAVGAVAPDFSGPTPEGESLSLNEVKGKVTLIDFWASWCKPCRAENPALVALYGKYHDKGLNIIGVSLDNEAEAWKKAIAEDGLSWYHISRLQYWQDSIARVYNIISIPANVILDEEGKIAAKDLRGEALETRIAGLLEQ